MFQFCRQLYFISRSLFFKNVLVLFIYFFVSLFHSINAEYYVDVCCKKRIVSAIVPWNNNEGKG
jgi:hypothetical protein